MGRGGESDGAGPAAESAMGRVEERDGLSSESGSESDQCEVQSGRGQGRAG